MNLSEIVQNGERENIEFKEYLTSFHLKENRLQELACQMNHRIIMGRGRAIYVIGVSDDGKLKGIDEKRFNETVEILRRIASEISADVRSVERFKIDSGYVGIVEIVKSRAKEHIIVGTAGHVDHGKSTLIGCLITGKPDDGDGAVRIFLDTLKHEIERGLSADLHFTVFGFKDGKPIRLKNPLNKNERAFVTEKAEKLISFVDTVGHEPWLRTTIRGLLGQKIDYGLLVIASNDGIMRTTKEHLGILLAMDLPVIIAITKIDMVSKERVDDVLNDVSQLLRTVGRIPYVVKDVEDVKKVSRLMNKKLIVPIVRTSAVTLEGYDLLEELLFRLPKGTFKGGSFLMYIDRIYRITGVGTVVSGSVKRGEIEEGETIYIGPFKDGSFRRVKVQSIEMHYYRVDRAEAGDIVGIAIKGVRYDEIRRGMVLIKEEPRAVKEFDADVYVFTHPTRIKRGYEPVVHIETISETVIFKEMEMAYMKAGDRGKVRIAFKYNPQFVYEGQKFIFREGRSKGMGEILRVYT